jgi:type II secretory pathway pseudopilin PulG
MSESTVLSFNSFNIVYMSKKFQITNFKLQIQTSKISIINWKFPLGFTLIELLISMTILILIGSVMIIIFFSAIRGTNKSQSMILLRQDGNYALTQMTKLVRLAKNVRCTATDTKSVIITAADYNIDTTLRCSTVADTISSESANGTFYLIRNPQKTVISACSFTCGTTGTKLSQFVAFSFTLASPDPKLGSADFSTTVLLRNSATE